MWRTQVLEWERLSSNRGDRHCSKAAQAPNKRLNEEDAFNVIQRHFASPPRKEAAAKNQPLVG